MAVQASIGPAADCNGGKPYFRVRHCDLGKAPAGVHRVKASLGVCEQEKNLVSSYYCID